MEGRRGLFTGRDTGSSRRSDEHEPGRHSVELWPWGVASRRSAARMRSIFDSITTMRAFRSACPFESAETCCLVSVSTIGDDLPEFLLPLLSLCIPSESKLRPGDASDWRRTLVFATSPIVNGERPPSTALNVCWRCKVALHVCSLGVAKFSPSSWAIGAPSAQRKAASSFHRSHSLPYSLSARLISLSSNAGNTSTSRA
mmetsp:Transcript_11541/g.27970  ORF Transcript_11541/g.27970 Transcript_11541/m.27970 type:complete len:200 (-) Transcript_11541:572-1171(-)